MVAATLKQDLLLPRAPGGNGSGAAMAVLVHAVLLAGLTLGVDWRTHSPEVVAAELWAAVPQSAAPPPLPPPPPPAAQAAPTPTPAPPPPVEKTPAPPQPSIAVEQERKRAEEKKKADEKKAEDERKERDKREKADKAAKAEQAAEKAEADRRERQREENLRRMLAQAGDTPSPTPGTGTAATNAAPSAAYAGRVKAAVRPNIVFTERLATNNAAEVEVTAAPGGSIISRKLVKSSGSAEWDEAVLRAIDKTRTLPRDGDGRVPPSLLLVFRPNE